MDSAAPEAEKLCRALRERGAPAKLENWDSFKHVDISIEGADVDIEIDGIQHNLESEQALSDLEKAYQSYKNSGIITLRILTCLLREKLDATADKIIKMCKLRKEKEEEEFSDFDKDEDVYFDV